MGHPKAARETPILANFGCELDSTQPLRGIDRSHYRRPGAPRGSSSSKTFERWLRRAFLGLMLAGSALISALSLPYFDFATLPPFVIEKLPLRFEALWLGSLRVHVAAAAIAFPLCLALMTRSLQRRVRWHRWLGRAAGVVVLFVLVPSGAVLSFDAKGGRIVTAGFLLSAGVIAWAVVVGVQAARRHKLTLHARAMRHVVGQMSVAVVSRAMIVGLDALGVNPDIAYVLALWGPVLASVVLVEALSLRSKFQHRNRVNSTERPNREISPLALGMRARALVRPAARFSR